jgi:hypothetical protein
MHENAGKWLQGSLVKNDKEKINFDALTAFTV